LDKDKNLAHPEEVLNNAGFTHPGRPGPLSDPDGTQAFHSSDHIIVLILIYIKYTKKDGFDNSAAL